MNSFKFLSEDEIKNLETVLIQNLERDRRNTVMLLTALYSGARASELLALSWDDVNENSGEIFLRTLKRGKPRFVVVPKFLAKQLATLKREQPSRPFNVSYNRLGEIWRLYRPTKKNLHCLRHTFAMRLLRKTKNIHFVQRAMGHKSINSTMVYLDYEYTSSEFKRMAGIR